MQVDKYIVKGFGISLYCKITNVKKDDSTMYPPPTQRSAEGIPDPCRSSVGCSSARNEYTISFGGKNNFCFIASIKPKKPFEVYIVNIEYNESCLKDNKLDERGGIVKLVRIALWTIKSIFPTIKHFTLIDSSHIDCIKGIKTHKLNLAYDYILKYNETWYEKQFNAKLPGSLTKDNCMINSLMCDYKSSLLVLDEPLEPFEIIKDKVNIAERYKSDYKNAKSPRDFIQKIRDKYERQYCVEVSSWLSGYMKALEIKIFQESWYIDTTSIEEPPHYSKNITNNNLCGGGFTRKNSNPPTFGPFEGGGSMIGYYDTFEDI